MSALLFLKDQWALVALALLILLVLCVLALVVRAATRPEAEEAPRRVAPRLRSDTLRSSFRQAVELIEAHLAGRAQRYGLPWVLVLDEGDGSAHLPLAQSGIASALGTDASAAAATPGLDWHFFDKGVVIAVQGSYLGGAEEDERRSEQPWDEFLGLCRDYRPERPFDALVLTVPAALLQDSHPDARLELAHLAKRANRRLWLAQNRFAMRFGVYLVVTGAERVPGFGAYARALPEWLRGGMLGWSSPYDLGMGYRSEWVDEALRETCRTVVDSSAELYASAPGPEIGTDFFLLPSRLQALQGQLQLYVDELMRPSSYHEPFILRGLYFSGDASEAVRPLAPAPALAEEPPLLLERAETAPAALPDSLRQPAFLRDLFEQKIFAEIGLTRPSGTQHLGRPLLARSLRWGAWGLAGAWALGLVGGSLVLQRQADTLQQTLQHLQHDSDLQLRAAQRGQPMPAEWQRERTLALLQLMEQIDQKRLWSVFMPGSWPLFDDLSPRVRERLEQAFGEVAVGALRQGLYERAARLSGVPQDAATGELIAGAPCTDPVLGETAERSAVSTLGIEDLPEFSRLLAYLAAVEQIEQATQALQRLLDPAQPAEGADLALLVRVVLGTDLPGSPDNAALLFRSRAARNGGLGATGLQLALRCSLQRSLAALDQRAFTENDLLYAQRELAQRIAELAAPDADAEDEAPRAWRELLAALKAQDTLLARGGGAWMSRPGFQPGPAWERAIARIGAARLLGADAARQARQDSEAGFRRFAAELAEETGTDKPLGVAWNEKDGRWVLAPAAGGLRDALQALLAQPWMARGGERGLTESASEALLAWDLGRLDQALGVADLRKRFLAEQLPRFPAELRPAIERLVSRQLAAQVVDHLANGLIPGGRPLGGDATASEAERSRLARVHALLLELGARRQAEQLRALQQRDASARLRALDEALDRAELYAPQGRNFGNWRGEKGPVLAAYGLPDAAALATYLGQQRGRIETLGHEAEQLLGQFGAAGSASMAGERWSAIGRDLERYRLKNPNSSLLALEGFLLAMSGEVDGSSCAERLGRTALPARGGDYFASRQQQLAVALQQRCGELRGRAQQEAWQQFAGQFNRVAAGRPPFANAPWGPEAPALEGEELAALLQSWDHSARQLRDIAADGRAPTAAAARRFVEQFERDRAFLAPLLPAEDGAIAGYDLLAEFRVNQAAEAEGHQVIDWRLAVGAQQIGWREPPRPLRWEPGQPIALQLRLAKDGPAQPRADERQPALRVEDRSVTLRYADPWALMSLLARHREAEAGRPEARAQLLRLEFPLTLQPEGGGPAQDGRARVFVRLTISPAGKRSPLAWPGPFPTRAPDLNLP